MREVILAGHVGAALQTPLADGQYENVNGTIISTEDKVFQRLFSRRPVNFGDLTDRRSSTADMPDEKEVSRFQQ
jgi:hypothetical protein